jgi:hypothetical protein
MGKYVRKTKSSLSLDGTKKTCSKCGEEKVLAEFYKYKGRLKSHCKDCVKTKSSKNYDVNKEELKIARKSYQPNENEMRICSKCGIEQPATCFIYQRKQCQNCRYEYVGNWLEENKDERKEKESLYYQNNKEHKKEYQNQNKDNINEVRRARRAERIISDSCFRLRENMSAAIRSSLKNKGGSKNGQSCFVSLGLTTEILKNHFESQWVGKNKWMNWDNWGMYDPKNWNDNDTNTWTWQIDHIKPHSEFHYTSMDCQEFQDCWSLDNLRCLSAKENNKLGTLLKKNRLGKHKKGHK